VLFPIAVIERENRKGKEGKKKGKRDFGKEKRKKKKDGRRGKT